MKTFLKRLVAVAAVTEGVHAGTEDTTHAKMTKIEQNVPGTGDHKHPYDDTNVVREPFDDSALTDAIAENKAAIEALKEAPPEQQNCCNACGSIENTSCCNKCCNHKNCCGGGAGGGLSGLIIAGLKRSDRAKQAIKRRKDGADATQKLVKRIARNRTAAQRKVLKRVMKMQKGLMDIFNDNQAQHQAFNAQQLQEQRIIDLARGAASNLEAAKEHGMAPTAATMLALGFLNNLEGAKGKKKKDYFDTMSVGVQGLHKTNNKNGSSFTVRYQGDGDSTFKSENGGDTFRYVPNDMALQTTLTDAVCLDNCTLGCSDEISAKTAEGVTGLKKKHGSGIWVYVDKDSNNHAVVGTGSGITEKPVTNYSKFVKNLIKKLKNLKAKTEEERIVLDALMRSQDGGNSVETSKDLDAVYAEIQDEIRGLEGTKDNVGSCAQKCEESCKFKVSGTQIGKGNISGFSQKPVLNRTDFESQKGTDKWNLKKFGSTNRNPMMKNIYRNRRRDEKSRENEVQDVNDTRDNFNEDWGDLPRYPRARGPKISAGKFFRDLPIGAQGYKPPRDGTGQSNKHAGRMRGFNNWD